MNKRSPGSGSTGLEPTEAAPSNDQSPGNHEAGEPSTTRSPVGPRSTAWRLVLALVAAVTVVGGIPYAIASKDARRPPIEEYLTYLSLPSAIQPDSLPSARVVEVTSGKTLTVLVDGREVAVRYLGVLTPARGAKCYREALDRNELLVGSSLFSSKKVFLFGEEPLDAAGFLPRYVFNEQEVSINATLIAEGFASAVPEGGPFEERLAGLEREAAGDGRGCLWK